MTTLSTLEPGQEPDVSKHIGILPTYKKVELFLRKETYDRLRDKARKSLSVSSGELSGIIDEVMREVPLHTEHQEMIKRKEIELAERKDPLWFEHYLCFVLSRIYPENVTRERPRDRATEIA